MGLTFAELTESPLGPISIIAGDDGLQRVAFTSLKLLKAKLDASENEPSFKGLEIAGTLLSEVNEFLFGIRTSFSVDIDWGVLEGFQRQVLELTAELPFGQLTTYGAIAKSLGKPGAARAVGRALGDNPMPILIPCHRVIGSDRSLRGYTNGIKTKAFLLGLEGHLVDMDRVTSSGSD